MELIDVLSIGNYFVQFIICVVLAGILVMEFIKRKSKRGLFLYMVVLMLSIFINILDTRLIFGIGNGDFISLIITFLIILWVFIFIINSIRVWEYIDTRLFLAVLFFNITTFIMRSSFSITNESSYALFVTLFYFISAICGYFFVIKFLVNSSGKKILLKNNIRNKKVLLVVGELLVLLIIFVVGFNFFIQSSQKITDELKIYSLDGSFSDGGIVRGFEKEFDVDVTLDSFDNENEMFEKFVSNPDSFDYDIVIVSDGLLKEMISNDYLYKIQKYNIPNLKYVNDDCIKEDFEDYTVPYFWGMTGLAFNKKYLPADTDSWGVLWSSRYSGRVSLLDNVNEVFGMAAKYIGAPIIPQTESELILVERFLSSQRSLLSGYENITSIEGKLISEDIWAAQIYSDSARIVQEKNDDIIFILPREGGVRWVRSFVILKNSENKKTAEAFINYINLPEVNKQIIEYNDGYSCNLVAMELSYNESLLASLDNNLKFFEYFSDYEEYEDLQNLKNKFWVGLIK